jgi:ring-1,2-phenylacetyl-CoA epoxidase subunit PaaD
MRSGEGAVMSIPKAVPSPANSKAVILANAGIHAERPITRSMDSRLRGNDGLKDAGLEVEQVIGWLSEIPDPEIPAISITDLGIVRGVQVDGNVCHITITPTYSGCPAMQVIAEAITEALRAKGVPQVVLHTQLTPAWTTDWMTASGKQKLRAYGIAPPAEQVIDISRLKPAAAIARRVPKLVIACPHCGSTHTEVTSQFGSTPCKALYKCLDCREPFDYFKCH